MPTTVRDQSPKLAGSHHKDNRRDKQHEEKTNESVVIEGVLTEVGVHGESLPQASLRTFDCEYSSS